MIFTKKLRKKLKIKTIRIKLENILPIQRIEKYDIYDIW
jgi:hypothetical protein